MFALPYSSVCIRARFATRSVNEELLAISRERKQPLVRARKPSEAAASSLRQKAEGASVDSGAAAVVDDDSNSSGGSGSGSDTSAAVLFAAALQQQSERPPLRFLYDCDDLLEAAAAVRAF